MRMRTIDDVRREIPDATAQLVGQNLIVLAFADGSRDALVWSPTRQEYVFADTWRRDAIGYAHACGYGS